MSVRLIMMRCRGYGARVPGLAVAIDAIMVVSVVVGLVVSIRAVRRVDPVAADGGSSPLAARPGFWLCVVVGAGFVNQVLFTIYVIRVHGGDASFIGRYLPSGWFALADHNRILRAVATAFPAPQLLAASVLRVQAVLELPLVVLAYLTVCRWWNRRLYQNLASPLPLTVACVAYTVTFCLIEWSLRNPYTEQDLMLRCVTCVLTVVGIRRLAMRSGAVERPAPARSVGDLVVFGGSAVALGYLILVVYDTVLLYNLARMSNHLLGGLTALAALTATRYVARRRTTGTRPGVGIETLTTGLDWFTALFFVPALPIRYALGFATPAVAAAAAATVIVTAVALTGAQLRSRLPPPRRRAVLTVWLAQSVVAALIGGVVATVALLVPPGYPEAKLLLAAALFLSAVTAIYALTDPLLAAHMKQHQPQAPPAEHLGHVPRPLPSRPASTTPDGPMEG